MLFLVQIDLLRRKHHASDSQWNRSAAARRHAHLVMDRKSEEGTNALMAAIHLAVAGLDWLFVFLERLAAIGTSYRSVL